MLLRKSENLEYTVYAYKARPFPIVNMATSGYREMSDTLLEVGI